MKSGSVYIACLILAAILMYNSPLRAEAKKIAIFELENMALLGTSEVGFLYDLLCSMFEELPMTHFKVFTIRSVKGRPCNEECRLAKVNTNADFFVTGLIVRFGEGYAALLKLREATTGQLVSSTNTLNINTLEEVISSLKRISLELRQRLVESSRISTGPVPLLMPSPFPKLETRPSPYNTRSEQLQLMPNPYSQSPGDQSPREQK